MGSPARGAAMLRLAVVFVCWLATGHLLAADLDLRLRIAWGGAQRSTWSGSISVDKGRLSNLTALGIESDVPGSVWLDKNVVRIREGMHRDYGGVDVSVIAPDDARLTVRLRSDEAANESIIEAPIQKLVGGDHRAPLDASGNYLLITRAPGDRLRVGVERPHLVYAPGENLSLEARVSPELLQGQETFDLVAEVVRARGGEALHRQTSTLSRFELQAEAVTVNLPAPREEGAYEARLILRRPPSIHERILPSTSNLAIVERRVQFVVFDRRATRQIPSVDWEVIAAIDLANPNWTARWGQWMRFDGLPGLPSRPPSNVAHETADILGRSALRLPPPAEDGERAWHAVPLSISLPGTPHLITLDLPTNHANQVGLSILEPNAAGYVYPITRDYGVFSAGESPDSENPWLTRQFLFWPKTTSPTLLFTNEHPEAPAQLGEVRLYRAHIGEKGFTESLPSEDRRIAAVLVDRPWLVESLGAREALDAPNNQSVDDWQTFYDAATRLVDYVQLSGYNAAVLSAFADGSTIYPSDILQSTPRYDTGVLASTAPDPLRKDFLELLLSAFDRSGLFLYVGLEFSTPLPELEKLRREADPQTSGIEWVGADGRSWSQRRRSAEGAAPRYNLLNEKVQDALLRVVREVIQRYNRHSSLRGVGVQLSGSGYAQLLEPQWGLDDHTIGRFTKETGIEVPGSGPGRFAIRERFLLGQKRKEWVAWRAEVLSGFYAKLRDELHETGRERELLLVATRLFERPEIRARIRPSLVAPANVVQVLLELGIDVASLGDEEGIIFLRPTFEVPLSPLARIAAEHQVNTSSELDAALNGAAARGDLVVFPGLSKNRRLLSFDQQNLFGENKSFTAPLTQMRPVGFQRRRALVRALAARDPSIFVEGGQILVTEMDDDLRRALEVFRKLPTADAKETTPRRQPVIVRTYRTETETIVCLVNESHWPQSVDVSIEAPTGTQLLELRTTQAPRTVPENPPRMVWPVELAGYGVHAARISTPSARIVEVAVQSNGTMREELTRRIEELDALTRRIPVDRPLDVLQNTDFEQRGTADEIVGWQVINPQGGGAMLDDDRRREGGQSLRITSVGPPVSVASLAFPAPATGRLVLSAHIRRGPPSERSQVRMFIEDAWGGTAYQRYAPLGAGDGSYRTLIDDVPLDSEAPLRVRFEVAGSGTVWIDDVQLSDLSFRNEGANEQLELNLIILEAQRALKAEAYSDCLESLEGYWPRFLAAHVPPPTPQQVAETSPPTSDAPATREAKAPGVADRLKNMLPRPFQ